MRTTETFEQHLRKSNLSENTIHSYLWTVNFYHAHYDEVNKENLLAYKGYLMEFFKPKTVNLRIQAMNKYLDFLHRDRLRLRAVRYSVPITNVQPFSLKASRIGCGTLRSSNRNAFTFHCVRFSTVTGVSGGVTVSVCIRTA